LLKKPKETKASNRRSQENVSAEEKIARLLGVLATKDMDQRTEQVALLRAVGFGISETAAILNTTENAVMVASSSEKRRKTSTKLRKKKH
jgi:hypothetical protein